MCNKQHRFRDGLYLNVVKVRLGRVFRISICILFLSVVHAFGRRMPSGSCSTRPRSSRFVSALNAVKNVTVDTTRDSVSVTWLNPAEQQPCTAHFHLSLTTADATLFMQAECCRYTAATLALEPCGAYGGHVAAIDFSDARGRPASFNFTARSAGTYRAFLCPAQSTLPPPPREVISTSHGP